MTATFCNAATRPNTNGYGARSGSGSSSASRIERRQREHIVDPALSGATAI
jgi:hypothetical protein